MEKKNRNRMIAGAAMMLVSVWGGAIAEHFAPGWLEFPVFITAFVVALAGFALAVCALCDYKWY